MTPMNREEVFLNGIAEGTGVDLTPMTREEVFLDGIANGKDVDLTPMTRREMFLNNILTSGAVGGIEEVELTLKDGYINDDGTIHTAGANKEKYTQPIPVEEGESLLLMLRIATSNTLWCSAAYYDKDGVFTSRTQINNAGNTAFDRVLEGTSEVGYIAFMFRTYDSVRAKAYKTKKVVAP